MKIGKIYVINTNASVYENILNKKDLSNYLVKQIPNSGRGNCFYKCISQFYNNKETYLLYYRKKVCMCINNKKDIDQINYPYIYGNNNKWMTYMENFNKIIISGNFVEEYEIINTCIEFRCNIVIYKIDDIEVNNVYKYETIVSNGECLNPFLPISIKVILLTYQNNSHIHNNLDNFHF